MLFWPSLFTCRLLLGFSRANQSTMFVHGCLLIAMDSMPVQAYKLAVEVANKSLRELNSDSIQEHPPPTPPDTPDNYRGPRIKVATGAQQMHAQQR